MPSVNFLLRGTKHKPKCHTVQYLRNNTFWFSPRNWTTEEMKKSIRWNRSHYTRFTKKNKHNEKIENVCPPPHKNNLFVEQFPVDSFNVLFCFSLTHTKAPWWLSLSLQIWNLEFEKKNAEKQNKTSNFAPSKILLCQLFFNWISMLKPKNEFKKKHFKICR